MFCTNCGHEIKQNSKFCTQCGTTVTMPLNHPAVETQKNSRVFESSSSSVLNSSIGYNNPKTEQSAPSASSRRKKANIRGIIYIIGVILFFIVIGAFSNNDNNDGVSNDAVTSNNTALQSLDTGNNQQAVTGFQQAVNNTTDNDTKIEALKNLAYAYEAQNNNDLALSTFKEALALASSGSSDYYLISAEIALINNDPNTALSDFNEANQLKPNDYQIINSLAIFYLDLDNQYPKLDNYKLALSYAQQANSLSTANTAKVNLAIAYYFNDDYTQAIPLLTTAMTTDTDINLAYWLGLAYAGNNDPTDAKIYLQKAINGGVKVPQSVTDYINSH